MVSATREPRRLVVVDSLVVVVLLLRAELDFDVDIFSSSSGDAEATTTDIFFCFLPLCRLKEVNVGVVVVVCAGFIARTIYSLLVDCARACRRVRYFFIMRKLKCRRILRTKHKKQVNNAIPASLAKLYDPAFLQKKRTIQRRARALFL